MGEPDPTLSKLVALKRQRAEQTFHAAQKVVEQAEAQLADLEQRLKALGVVQSDFAAQKLAFQSGYVEKLVADIDAQRVWLAKTMADCDRARTALKEVFHSQERLADMAQLLRRRG